MSAPLAFHPPALKVPLLVRLLRWSLLTLLGMGALAMLLLLALLGLQLALEDRIMPGVQVGSVNIGGMSPPRAAAAILETYGAAEKALYTFRDGERSWTATATELGLRLPVEALVESAYAIGHADDRRQSLRQQARAWFNGVQLPVTVHFDEASARAYLLGLSREIDRERRDATLSIDGYRVYIDGGIGGRRLDVGAALAALRADILAEAPTREIPLPIRESAARIGNVEAAAALAHTALSAPVQLIGTRPNGEMLAPWVVSLEQIRAGLSVTKRDDGSDLHFDVAVDLSALASYIRTLGPALSTAPTAGRFDFDPASGQLTATAASSGGRALQADATIAALEAAVFEPVNRRVGMVFEAIPPPYPAGVSAAELGISELVAEATTYFWGSWQNRRSNIALGASKLNGIILAPGEEFSFNRHLGEITEEAGYLEGSVILGGATVTGIGGGICQVSTTLFRAAFSGGFAITERNSHGYRVGYYEYAGAGPGLDAAIWQPDVDLRFQNNSPHHLLIESEFLPAQHALQFRIYSTRHWRTTIEPAVVRDIVPAPEDGYVVAADLAPGEVRQIDYSADGADVWVARNVYDTAGSLLQRDQIFTHYLPWQAVFEVAAGDLRLPADDEEEAAAGAGGIAPVGVVGA